MKNVLLESFQLYNLPFTVLLIVILSFWVLVILGMFEIESLDFEMVNAGNALSFGDVPFSIGLSFFTVQVWFYALTGNFILNSILPLHAAIRLLGVFIVICPLAFFLTRKIVKPFEKIFKDHVDPYADLVGKTCQVTSYEVSEKFGTAEITTDGAPLLLHVRANDSDMLKKEDEALIVEYHSEENYYFVCRV